jgi:hypothetical protein
MKNVIRFTTAVLTIASCIPVLFLTGCATTMNLPSHWPDKPIVIDGKNTEWEHTYLVDDNKLIVSCDNDSNFVYVLLATNDRQLTMSMMRGLTVWFDAKGEHDQTFGIRYPLGGGFRHEGGGNGESGGELSMEPAGQFGMPPTEVEILGPGKDDRHRMQMMETGGIQARYRISVNSFVYELKVPLASGDKYPFAIHSTIGQVIGLGLETSQTRMERPEGESHRRSSGMEPTEGSDEGNDEGQGFGGVGRGGRMGQAGMRGSTGPLDLWMKVKLVPKDALTQ